MTNQDQNPNDKKVYDLEERTARFGESIIDFVKTLTRDTINNKSKETKHWLRMIARASPNKKGECKALWNEVQELALIFSSILLPKKNK